MIETHAIYVTDLVSALGRVVSKYKFIKLIPGAQRRRLFRLSQSDLQYLLFYRCSGTLECGALYAMHIDGSVQCQVPMPG